MKISFGTIIFLMGFFMTYTASALSVDEQEILKISKEKFRIMAEANIEALDKLLDSKFTLTHLTGHVGSREEWLGDLKSKRFIYHIIEPKSFDVKTEGSKVIIISKSVFDATIYGGRGIYHLQLTEIYEQVSRKWKLMKMVAKTYSGV